MCDSSGDGEKMEPLRTQRDYVSQWSLGGCACVRQGWLEGGTGGKRKESGWPSQFVTAPFFRAVVREGSPGDAAGSYVVEESSGGASAPRMVAGGEGSLPGRRRRGARLQPCAARVLPSRVTRGS